MVQFYVVQVRLGRMTVEDVPELWREDVRIALSEG